LGFALRRAAVIGLVLAALAGGCGGGDGGGATLADGRHFGYVRAVDPAAEPATIDFDVADFLRDQLADGAAVEDGVIRPGEPVPNDYYIRNDDESVETLELSPQVKVTHVQCPTSCTEGLRGDFAAFAASFEHTGQTLNDEYRGAESQYWVTLADGEVVAIDEQYLP
jgi:hypothetical protein